MRQEASAPVSPFAALSYQEQQDRWLEWRSRQLEYHPVSAASAAPEKPVESAPPMRQPPPLQPCFPAPAPTRHGELDKLWAKHRNALRQAGCFHSVTISGKTAPPHASAGSTPE